ncbi:hypothetical protein DIPPA_15311 [Diplonema papillatum]|nr:hypothetical protein DIPPA_15311 [Diplonema papillatum]
MVTPPERHDQGSPASAAAAEPDHFAPAVQTAILTHGSPPLPPAGHLPNAWLRLFRHPLRAGNRQTTPVPVAGEAHRSLAVGRRCVKELGVGALSKTVTVLHHLCFGTESGLREQMASKAFCKELNMRWG